MPKKHLDIDYQFVAIIECLPEDERQSYPVSLRLSQFLGNNGVRQYRWCCGNRASVLHVLERYWQMARNGNQFCLHFVSHGDKDGLWLKATDESITWKDFRGLLNGINSAMEHSLIVNMSSCFGLHGIKIVEESEGADYPFFGLIGPAVNLEVTAAMEVNEMFYGRMLGGKDIPTAADETNAAIGTRVLYYISAEGYRTIQLGRWSKTSKTCSECTTRVTSTLNHELPAEPSHDWVWRVCHAGQYSAMKSGDVSRIETATELTGHPTHGGRPVFRFTRDRELVRNFEAGRAGGAVVRVDLSMVPEDCRTDRNALGNQLPDIYILAETVMHLFEVDKEL